MVNDLFHQEKKLLDRGFSYIIGIDEAGRGPLAGPVTAAAVMVRKSQIPNPKSQKNTNPPVGGQNSNDKNWELIKDSKMLSAKQREKLYDFIQENFYVGVGICDHKTIDRMNILQATYLAMKEALTDLKNKTKHNIFDEKIIILVDGNKQIPNLSLEQKAIINGDKIVKSISAASIIAKVTRDRIMLQMHQKYPEYCFDQHKGYGTKLHMAMLQKHGPCPIHRQSFQPVKILAKNRF